MRHQVAVAWHVHWALAATSAAHRAGMDDFHGADSCTWLAKGLGSPRPRAPERVAPPLRPQCRGAAAYVKLPGLVAELLQGAAPMGLPPRAKEADLRRARPTNGAPCPWRSKPTRLVEELRPRSPTGRRCSCLGAACHGHGRIVAEAARNTALCRLIVTSRRQPATAIAVRRRNIYAPAARSPLRTNAGGRPAMPVAR